MQRRGFIGSFVATIFSLPTLVQRATAEAPPAANANPQPVSIPYAWTANATNTTTTLTTWPGVGFNGTGNTFPTLVLLLAGALVGALAWGTCNNSRASEATLKLQAALAAHDSLKAVAAAHRDSLSRAVQALRSDSAFLEAQRRATRSQAKDSIGKLLAVIQDSTQRAAASEAVRVVYLEVEACQDQLSNCEARAQNAEARARGDSVSLGRAEALLDTVRVRWSQAERKAQPSFFRDLWRSRSVTLPLAAVSILLLLRR